MGKQANSTSNSAWQGGGVFAPFVDVDFFRQVEVDPEAGTIVWPNGVDLCPDGLYSLVMGEPLPMLDRT